MVEARRSMLVLACVFAMGCGSDEGSSDPTNTGGSGGASGSGGNGGSGGSGGSSSGGSSGSGATGGSAGGGGGSVACSTDTNTAGGPDPWGGCWPGSANTGIPVGTALTAYEGPCTITVDDTEIDAKTVTCDPLMIQAANVTITRSKIEGSVLVDAPDAGFSFSITDSEVDAGPIAPGDTDDNSGIGKSNFTATRVDVHGGKRGIWCEHECTVTDSWVHDQSPDPSGVAHESGMRMGDHATISHNSILCNAPDFPPDAGCSADLTGYGDFAPIEHNTIHRNLLLATTGGACAYGGSSGDDGSKPFGDQANNIVFEENVFQRGPGGKCGSYFPITDFDETRPGNQWIGNAWDDGETLPPAN